MILGYHWPTGITVSPPNSRLSFRPHVRFSCQVCWLIFIVNSTRPRVTWEPGTSAEDLYRVAGPGATSVTNVLIGAGGPSLCGTIPQQMGHVRKLAGCEPRQESERMREEERERERQYVVLLHGFCCFMLELLYSFSSLMDCDLEVPTEINTFLPQVSCFW